MFLIPRRGSAVACFLGQRGDLLSNGLQTALDVSMAQTSSWERSIVHIYRKPHCPLVFSPDADQGALRFAAGIAATLFDR